jgi:hypothetical protein
MAMMYPAHQLADPAHFTPLDRRQGEPIEHLKAHKIKGATMGWEPLRESIQQEGIKEPISLVQDRMNPSTKPLIVNGHHRIYTAEDLNPSMEVPVKWSSHPWQGHDFYERST